jgi:putative transposase
VQLLDPSHKRGPRHRDLRTVLNGILYIRHTGAQWRYLPSEFGPWTRCWSQFRRWSRNGTWARLLAGLHAVARQTGFHRAHELPSLVTIDSALARGASNGGATFHDRGGPRGWTKGAKRVVAVDVTGLPLAARVVPASTTESDTVGLLLQDMHDLGQDGRLEVALVDRGTGVRQAARHSKRFGLEVRRVFHEDKPVDEFGRGMFVPLPFAWRVEVAHGACTLRELLTHEAALTPASSLSWLTLPPAARPLLLREMRASARLRARGWCVYGEYAPWYVADLVVDGGLVDAVSRHGLLAGIPDLHLTLSPGHWERLQDRLALDGVAEGPRRLPSYATWSRAFATEPIPWVHARGTARAVALAYARVAALPAGTLQEMAPACRRFDLSERRSVAYGVGTVVGAADLGLPAQLGPATFGHHSWGGAGFAWADLHKRFAACVMFMGMLFDPMLGPARRNLAVRAVYETVGDRT